MTANLPASPETRQPAMLEEEFGLALMEGEQVLVKGEPMQGKLYMYMMVGAVLLSLMTVIGILAIPIIHFAVRAYVKKHRYWVTSARVVVTNGIIGFRARSIPLERVSDVAISCNFIERAMGLRSVVVRDMTGEALNGATMMGAPNATALQRQILDEVQAVNRRDAPSGGDKMVGRPYREIEGDQAQARMLEILGRIEKNTRSAES